MRLLANGVMPVNNPLISLVGSYIELANTVTPRVTSGIYTLYAIQSGACGFGGMDGQYVIRTALQESTDSGALTPDYVVSLMKLNITSYIQLMINVIQYRINELIQMKPTPATSAINTSRMRRGHYWPSGNTVRSLESLSLHLTTSHKLARQDFLSSLAIDVQTDLDYTVGMGGMASPNPPCPHAILGFIKNIRICLMYGDMSPTFTSHHLPILKILHAIARLLCGSVDQVEWESRTSMLPPELVKLNLSDVTLACIPAPSIELVESFVEPDEAALSTRARQFLDKLTVFYTTNSEI